MQVTTSRVREGAYTTYTLTAVLSGQSITAKHIIPNDAYAALKVEDASASTATMFAGRYTPIAGHVPLGSAPAPTSSGASPGQRVSGLIALGISAVSCRGLTGAQIPASPARVGRPKGYFLGKASPASASASRMYCSG